MKPPILTPTRFENAIWEGLIASDTQPSIEAFLHGERIEGVTVDSSPEGWVVQIPVPKSALSDGVHSIVIRDETTQDTLGSFTVIAGVPAAESLLAEVDLLRAELDMLKRVVRQAHKPGE